MDTQRIRIHSICVYIAYIYTQQLRCSLNTLRAKCLPLRTVVCRFGALYRRAMRRVATTTREASLSGHATGPLGHLGRINRLVHGVLPGSQLYSVSYPEARLDDQSEISDKNSRSYLRIFIIYPVSYPFSSSVFHPNDRSPCFPPITEKSVVATRGDLDVAVLQDIPQARSLLRLRAGLGSINIRRKIEQQKLFIMVNRNHFLLSNYEKLQMIYNYDFTSRC